MSSLTHVLMFSNRDWQPITAQEAAKLHPGGSVAARSGLFMCDLCGQYVSFTKEGQQGRHFRHQAREADKSCPERTLGPAAVVGYFPETHELPIRIRLFPNDFSFEMGLLGVSSYTLRHLQNQMVRIYPGQRRAEPFSYILKDRLRANEITYVSIGQVPFPQYQIDIDSKNLSGFIHWPTRVQGIDPKGSLFDGASQKKLPYDADVQVGRSYYLLRSSGIQHACSSISLERILTKSLPGRYWHLYKVSALDYDEDSAKFFLYFHCRLTDRPVFIQPIWPVYTKSPYVICHDSSEMVFYIRGNVTTKCFPAAARKDEYPAGKEKIVYINCNDRQQLISAGRTHMLKYTYLWKVPLKRAVPIPSVFVTDIEGTSIAPGQAGKLPPKGALRIRAPYDGAVILYNDGRLLEKRPLHSNETIEIDSLQFGYQVDILQGLDRVWTIQYQRNSTKPAQEERLLLKLQNAVGPLILVPHSLGATAKYLKEYPKVKQWLYEKIRIGHMPLLAYQEYRHFLRQMAVHH